VLMMYIEMIRLLQEKLGKELCVKTEVICLMIFMLMLQEQHTIQAQANNKLR